MSNCTHATLHYENGELFCRGCQRSLVPIPTTIRGWPGPFKLVDAATSKQRGGIWPL